MSTSMLSELYTYVGKGANPAGCEFPEEYYGTEELRVGLDKGEMGVRVKSNIIY